MNILGIEAGNNYILASAITAFGFFTGNNNVDAASLGHVCELPEGAGLEVCGQGFNDRTVKARYGDGYCYVYCRDLQAAVTALNLVESYA